MEISVLDLGSTTFHLQHVRADPQGHFATCLDDKRALCLGAQVFADGFLSPASIAQGLVAASELLSYARSRCPDHQAVVATSAIRSASNGAALVAAIERRHGVRVRVLESRDEAQLAYLGQSTARDVGGRRAAVVDLGGGSVEIAVGEGTRCMHAVSLPIGAVRLRATQLTASFGRRDAAQLARALRAEVGGALRRVRELEPAVVVFGSGSARAVRKLLLRDSAIPGKVGPIDATGLREALNAHLDYDAAQLVAAGVEPQRASSVLIAATIIVELLEQLERPSAHVTDKGLRDGVALEIYRRHAARSAACGRRAAAY